jgi:hypothetical protein
MFRLFGTKKETKTDITKTIFSIKDTISTLEKRKEYVEKHMQNERAQAKNYVQNNNKERALFHLKKIKMYEKEQKLLDNNIFNLETQRMAIESQVNIKSVIDVMKMSSQTLQESINPSDISNVVDEISELIQTQQEVSEELSRPIISYDDDELLQELDNLCSEQTQPQLQQQLQLPSVPTQKPIIKNINKSEEEELEELTLMMTQ